MIDNNIMFLVNPTLANGRIDAAREAFARWQKYESDERQAKYREYREYYDGAHDTRLTDRQLEYLQIKAGQTFDANYCPIVVDALAERFIITGFEATDEEGEMDEDVGGDNGILWRWWNANGMDSVQGDLHTAAIRDGDTYLIIEWDNEEQRPLFSHELAYDGTDGVSVVYQNEKRNKIWFAFKKWNTVNDDGEAVTRLNIYTDDAIYKFTDDMRVTPQSRLFFHWREYVENEGDEWPIAWVDSQGRPLGVPVVHFKYKANGYNYGLSRLDNIIPMQNALNKSIIDLLASADVTAFRMYTMIGDEPKDDAGNPIVVAPGQFLYSTRTPAEVAIGVIPGEDLRPVIELVNSFIVRIAQMSRTPLSYFQATKQVASDDTQEANESGIVSMAAQQATSFGNGWEYAINMARRLHNTFGAGGLREDVNITAVWDEFKRINEDIVERTRAETNEIKARIFDTLIMMGIERPLAAEMAGYAQDIVERLADQRPFNEIGDGIEQ